MVGGQEAFMHTILVASVGVKSVYQLCKMLTRATVKERLCSAMGLRVLIQVYTPDCHLG